MDINGGDKNRVFLHDLIKITEGTVSEGTIFMHIYFFFISGNGAQFQIRVVTTAANTGVAGTGFDLIYSQVGCS